MKSNLRFLGELLEAEHSYWSKKFEGRPEAIRLPGDFKRTGERGKTRAAVEFELRDETKALLNTICGGKDSLIFTALVTGMKVFLYRFRGEADIIVGTGIHKKFSDVGSLNRILALRDTVKPEMRSLDLLQQVKSTVSEAYRNQKYPFERVEELSGARAEGSRLFEIVVGLDSVNDSDELLGIEAETTFFFSGAGALDSRMKVRVEYDAGVYKKGTIARYVEQFESILSSMLRAPETPILELPLFDQSERDYIIKELNDTVRDYRTDSCIHQLFEDQVNKSPDAVAFVLENALLTYDELNRRANCLAHYLRELSVGPDSTVGMQVDGSLEMVIGVLGVLKAGGGYLPLDSVYPRERLTYMAEDANARVILTEEQYRSAWAGGELRVVTMDGDWNEIAARDSSNPVNETDPDNIAYVIYTSGSTGRPKGIAMPHRPLVNLLEWHNASLATEARTLQFAPLSFDASFHEIFSAWTSGGTLYPIPNAVRFDTIMLGSLLVEERIQKITLPVVMLQQLAEEAWGKAQSLADLVVVITTGEQLLITAPILNLFQSMSWSSLHNHYGPSETHVVTSFVLPREAVQDWPSYSPIGKPIWNTSMYILDQNFCVMPFGIPAELYIGGDSLARGYLGRPSLTAERFTPNPLSLSAGERLYRTGDLARYLDGGDLELLGRMDHQTKIRGFRVEPGEIEAVIAEHPAVKAAVVLVRDIQGENRLIAYVTPENTNNLTAADLNQFAKQRLPEYMLPWRIVVMDEMPLNQNGKIDRKRLPDAEWSREAIEDLYLAPATAAEKVVAGIWSRVLDVEEIGIRDNFFRLGGHSMMATRLMFRIREAFGIEIPLRVLFAEPTVEGLINGMAKIWGGRETVEEVASALLEVDQLSEDELSMLMAENQ